MKKSKTLHIQEYELPITIQEEKKGGFTAVCSVWKDCYAQGETLEEALNEISYVASSLIELYREEDMSIPHHVIARSSVWQNDEAISLNNLLI